MNASIVNDGKLNTATKRPRDYFRSSLGLGRITDYHAASQRLISSLLCHLYSPHGSGDVDELLTEMVVPLIEGYLTRSPCDGVPSLTYAFAMTLLTLMRRHEQVPSVSLAYFNVLGIAFYDMRFVYLSQAEASAIMYSACEDIWSRSSHEMTSYLQIAAVFYLQSFKRNDEINFKSDPIERQEKIQNRLLARRSGASTTSSVSFNVLLWVSVLDYRRLQTRMLLFQAADVTPVHVDAKSVIFSQVDCLLANWSDTWTKIQAQRYLAPLPMLRIFIHASLSLGVELIHETFRLGIDEGLSRRESSLYQTLLGYLHSLLNVATDQCNRSGLGVGWIELCIILVHEIKKTWGLECGAQENEGVIFHSSLGSTDDRFESIADLLDDEELLEFGEDPFFLRDLPDLEDPLKDEPTARDYAKISGLEDPYANSCVDGLMLNYLIGLPVLKVKHGDDTVQRTDTFMMSPAESTRVSHRYRDGRHLRTPSGRRGNPPDRLLKSLARLQYLDHTGEGYISDPGLSKHIMSKWSELPRVGRSVLPGPPLGSALNVSLPNEPDEGCENRPLSSLVCHYLWRCGGDASCLEWVVEYTSMTTFPLHHQLIGMRYFIDGAGGLTQAGWRHAALTLLDSRDAPLLEYSMAWAFPLEISKHWILDYYEPRCGCIPLSDGMLMSMIVVLGCLAPYPLFNCLATGLLDRFCTSECNNILDQIQPGQLEFLNSVRQLWTRLGGHPGGAIIGDDNELCVFLSQKRYDNQLIQLLANS
eukprot:GHVH01010743.1.p1 GENE.GHVH01010743.1~~GHVH01010743.1.p1  ORF type:complete len:757 (+),score=75.96 GHVH01010743.1:27-2297(+)